MTPTPIRFSDLPVSPWHNGAGRKADIATGPGWHVGFAWLDADAPFSDFSGQDRTITLIDGPGFVLDFANGASLRVDAPYQPASFDGGWQTRCRLLGRPGLVLNAMTDRAQWRHSVAVHDAVTRPDIEPKAAGARFVVLLTGAATMGTVAHEPRDSVRITAPTALRAHPGSLICVLDIEHA